jgi:hypothetical protein
LLGCRTIFIHQKSRKAEEEGGREKGRERGGGVYSRKLALSEAGKRTSCSVSEGGKKRKLDLFQRNAQK